MESQENITLLIRSNRDISSSDIEMDNIIINFSEVFLNNSITSTTENGIKQGAALYEVDTVVVVILSLFYGAICIIAIFGNLLVLCLVLASKKMRTVTNLFIANLALADIIIAMFAIPFQFQAALLQRWNLPRLLCALCPFVQVLTVTVSILTLVVIALDRYRAVMHPFKPNSSKKMACGSILAIWVLSILLAIPTELDYSVIKVTTNGRVKDFCTNVYLPPNFRIYYNHSIVLIQYFLPLIIISKAYFHICRTLWSSNIPGNQEQTRDALVMRKKKKVIKMLFTVIFMFALCWFPLQTYNLLQAIFPSINSFEYINILWFCFHWLAMSNSCCNPFIYAFYNKKFKTELFKRVPCLERIRQEYRTRSSISKSNVQMKNRINGQSFENKFEMCNIKVIYNPIQEKGRKENVYKICDEDLKACKIDIGTHLI